MTQPFWIVFDGPPSHESGRFIEVDDGQGHSLRAGEWVSRGDGYWGLGPFVEAKAGAEILDAAEEIIEAHDRNMDINENGNATGAWISTADIDVLRSAVAKARGR